MSSSQALDRILAQAKDEEKKYNWTAAAKLHKEALSRATEAEDFQKAGKIRERIGYCLYKRAFQAESQEEFKRRILEAIEDYEKAAEVCEKAERAQSLYCKTMALYATSWTLVDVSRKSEVLHDCERLLKEAMKELEEAGDRRSYGKACVDLSRCLWDITAVEWNWSENQRRLEEALDLGQKAIATLSQVGDERELARAYIITGLHSAVAGLGGLGEEKEEAIQMAVNYAEKALELSNKTGDASLIAGANWLALEAQSDTAGDPELSRRYGEEALRQAKRTKDNFMIGSALQGLAYATICTMDAEENPQRKNEKYEKAMKYAEAAVHHHLKVCRYDYLPEIYTWYVENHLSSAGVAQTSLERKRHLLEKAVEVGREGLEYAKESGMPTAAALYHALSKTLYSFSKLETQGTEKRRLLEEALERTEQSIRLGEQAGALYDAWDHIVFQSYAALIKAKLATKETETKKKTELLEETVSHIERCIELCTNR